MMKTHEYIKRGDILYDIKTEKTGIYSGQCFTSYPPYWGIVDGDKISDRYCINLSHLWREALKGNVEVGKWFNHNEWLNVFVSPSILAEEEGELSKINNFIGSSVKRDVIFYDCNDFAPHRGLKHRYHNILYREHDEKSKMASAAIGDWVGVRALNEAARIAHEVNRSYCLSLGDTSQPRWEDAPEWQKDSAKKGVQSTVDRYWQAAYRAGSYDVDLDPEVSHQGWMKQKIDEGWVYGPVKDPEKKTHPCIVPYSELPTEQKAKDYIFLSVAKETFNALVKAYDGR